MRVTCRIVAGDGHGCRICSFGYLGIVIIGKVFSSPAETTIAMPQICSISKLGNLKSDR